MSASVFTTHTGEQVSGDRLQSALNAVADTWEQMGRDIRAEDAYASHVTEADKDAILTRDLDIANEVRRGEVNSFTIWQRIDAELTGECVPLFRS